MHTGTSKRRLTRPLVVVCLLGLAGCGTNLDALLYQTAGAASRTFLDLLLTDLANTLADSLNQGGTPGAGDGTGDGGQPPPSDGPPLDELTGDPASGEAIYAANGCGSCHCADASGGCALSAPSLVGVAVQTLDDRLRGDAVHPGGKFNFTNQDIVDLQAYLGSLGTGNG